MTKIRRLATHRDELILEERRKDAASVPMIEQKEGQAAE
jgi:hypothetical protein